MLRHGHALVVTGCCVGGDGALYVQRSRVSCCVAGDVGVYAYGYVAYGFVASYGVMLRARGPRCFAGGCVADRILC